MLAVDDLSPAQCILLGANYACSANIQSLHKLTPARPDVFDQELVFRILLTFLPESLDPAQYTTYIREVGSRIYLEQHTDELLDLTSVQDIQPEEAQVSLRKLHLRPLADAQELQNGVKDSLTLFLTHRARLIDSETGLLPLVPLLVGSFLERTTYLRDWFISSVLPLLRLDYEYHPDSASPTQLATFESWHGFDGVSQIMAKALDHSSPIPTNSQIAADFRGIVGPWTCGANMIKWREIGYKPLPAPVEKELRKLVTGVSGAQLRCQIDDCKMCFDKDSLWRQHVGKKHWQTLEALLQDPSIPRSQTPELHYADDSISHKAAAWVNAWRSSFEWLVNAAVDKFDLVVNLLECWDGPKDIDLGEYASLEAYRRGDTDLELDLLRQYCQAAFAAIYAVEHDDTQTIDGAHAVLVRLAYLLGFEPPPDLATSIDLLPKIERHAEPLEKLPRDLLQFQALLLPGQPLTSPTLETFSLLQMFVYSSYQLLGVGQPMSVAKVGKIRFWSDGAEQLQTIVHILDTFSAQKMDEAQWLHLRSVLIWLWGWGLGDSPNNPKEGYGVFGKIEKDVLERKILDAYCQNSQLELINSTYLDREHADRPLASDDVARAVEAGILHHYDTASNGNRSRGGMKRALDLLQSVKTRLPQASFVRRLSALIDATHALSFYSLTLEPGTPLQPRALRRVPDPLSLIQKVLQQNRGSYTKVDDLVSIAGNLVVALGDGADGFELSSQVSPAPPTSPTLIAGKVTGMAIEAALAEDDFETAYSLVTTRLTELGSISSADEASATVTADNDVAWRAAYNAGKHRAQGSATRALQPPQQIRRLEQRMELLSQSLVLAPSTDLPEVLAAWRKSEEELLTVLADESAEETEFNDRADKGSSGVPGGFGMVGEPAFTVQPRRKELGRGANEEAPMGLFDVARGAAAAFSRNTSTLRSKAAASSAPGEARPALDANGSAAEQEGRVRKRDMVANAVTGGFASGVGWIIGATPARPEERG